LHEGARLLPVTLHARPGEAALGAKPAAVALGLAEQTPNVRAS
jgi:hypothetical protein